MNTSRLVITIATILLLAGCSASKKSKVKISRKMGSDPTSLQLRQKYAEIIGVPPDSIKTIKLYTFIDEWYGTPYKYGGTDKSGIDCSAFIQKLLLEVYSIDIDRTAVTQFYAKNIERFASSKYLREGDLVFYQTDPAKPISHVGIYLTNRRFVNAASSRGVSIYNMDDAYWRAAYVGCGRIITPK